MRTSRARLTTVIRARIHSVRDAADRRRLYTDRHTGGVNDDVTATYVAVPERVAPYCLRIDRGATSNAPERRQRGEERSGEERRGERRGRHPSEGESTA